MGIGWQSLAMPLTVYNVDGSENKQGKVTHYCWLRILLTGQTKLQMFYIMALGKDGIILGYPFFYTFNPTINWCEGRIEEGAISLHTPRYKYRYKDIAKVQKEAIVQVGKPKGNEAIYLQRNIAQDWAREASQNQKKMMTETIPKEYHHHMKVFFEKESKRFPPVQEEDMSIQLKGDAPEVINCKVYPLTKDERITLQKFLATELELGRIKEGPSPYTSPVYFINKKDLAEK